MATNRIKAVLADENKSNKWLASQLKMSETTISRWTSNRQQPSIQQLGDVASILGVDIRELLKPSKEEE